MLYVLLLLALALLAAWLWGKWLWRESRDALVRAEEALHVLRGGLTARRVLHQLRAHLAAGDLFIAVSPRTRDLHAALQANPAPPSSASAPRPLFGVGLSPSTGQICLIAPGPGNSSVSQHTLPLSAIRGIERTDNTHDPLPRQAPAEALQFHVRQDGVDMIYSLPVEPAWGVGAADLEQRIAGMIQRRDALPAGPVLLH